MDLFARLRAAFAVGDTRIRCRSLVVEQFRILRKQVPVLYAVLLVDSISVALVLPLTVSAWLRFGLPTALLALCLLWLVQWLRLKTVDVTPEQAHRELRRTRVIAVVLNAGFNFWIVALFATVDPAFARRSPCSSSWGASARPTASAAFQRRPC
ncbi:MULTISPECIES: hypothetical protein [unclassified Bradyrhizobium]|uniref:hypothetical protein n=1 Tax=unclassified Bradyrhizobium TaxID=2631580 RepID=UPI001FFB0CAA|nr:MULTISPECIES: hypothetical protein [unclassified Bradyrhizobium]